MYFIIFGEQVLRLVVAVLGRNVWTLAQLRSPHNPPLDSVELLEVVPPYPSSRTEFHVRHPAVASDEVFTFCFRGCGCAERGRVVSAKQDLCWCWRQLVDRDLPGEEHVVGAKQAPPAVRSNLIDTSTPEADRSDSHVDVVNPRAVVFSSRAGYGIRGVSVVSRDGDPAASAVHARFVSGFLV